MRLSVSRSTVFRCDPGGRRRHVRLPLLAQGQELPMSAKQRRQTPEDAGFPSATSFRGTILNEQAQLTLIHIRLAKSSPIMRLFWRSFGAASYQELGPPPEHVSLEHPVTCEQPVLYVV